MIISIFLAGIVFIVWNEHRCNEQLAAIKAMDHADKIFGNWRLRNQGVYIGLSDEGRLLLSRYIEAYDWFLRTHSFIDGREYREWLVSLFDDLPPKPPVMIPCHKNKKGVSSDALSLFIVTN